MSAQAPDLDRLRASLARTPGALCALLRDIDDHDARWRPPGGQWSILEIVNHMADEDADDFAPRLESTLRDPAAPWAPLDPEGAARDRRYNERELSASLERFEAVRTSSLNGLAELTREGAAIDWSRAYRHPKIGPIRAGDLLASWVAHDHLHLRQIAKRLFQLAQRDAGDYATRYAGEWGA